MTYTREQILSMPAEKELDILVAERVMGFKIETPWAEQCTIWDGREVRYFEPSIDISAAWEVVEKLSRGKTDNSFVLEFHYERYYARFGNVPFRPYRDEMYESAPEAICKAALLASLEESGGTGDE